MQAGGVCVAGDVWRVKSSSPSESPIRPDHHSSFCKHTRPTNHRLHYYHLPLTLRLLSGPQPLPVVRSTHTTHDPPIHPTFPRPRTHTRLGFVKSGNKKVNSDPNAHRKTVILKKEQKNRNRKKRRKKTEKINDMTRKRYPADTVNVEWTQRRI